MFENIVAEKKMVLKNIFSFKKRVLNGPESN